MNILLNKDKYYHTAEDLHEPEDVEIIWEQIAIAMVLLIVAAYFSVSIWSVTVLLTGDTQSGGIIGLICKFIHPA